MQLRTILVPTDFSPPSQVALEIASSLARDQKARLIIAHVMDLPVAYSEGPLVYTFDEREVEDARRELARMVPSDAAIAYEHKLLKGDTASTILQAADDIGAELIVVGTHGNTGMMHIIVGSVADSVMRRARCPVVAVKSPTATTTPPMESATMGAVSE